MASAQSAGRNGGAGADAASGDTGPAALPFTGDGAASTGLLRGRCLAVAALQEGILGDLAVDCAREFEVGHLQEANGLLQLRRQDETLLLSQLEANAGGEAHPCCLEAEPLSEVHPPHRRVGDDLGRRALAQHGAIVQNVGAVDDI